MHTFFHISILYLSYVRQMSPASSGSSEVARVESFRPNFVVDQTPLTVSSSSADSSPLSLPHEEDFWHTVTFPVEPHTALPRDLLDTNEEMVPPSPMSPPCSYDPLTLLSTGPCARCSMVNIVTPPPRAGSGSKQSIEDTDVCLPTTPLFTKNPNTLKTLSTYRKGQHGAGGGRNDIYFGQYFAYDPASQVKTTESVGVGGNTFLSRGFVYENMPVLVQHAD